MGSVISNFQTAENTNDDKQEVDCVITAPVLESNSKLSLCGGNTGHIELWRLAQVCAHWIRDSNVDAWPNALSDIILRYLVDIDKCSTDVSIQDTFIQVVPPRKAARRLVVSQCMFLNAEFHSLCWEIQMKQKGNGWTEYAMGLIDADYIDNFMHSQQDWIKKKHSFALHINHGDYPSFCENEWEYIIHKNLIYDLKHNDRFRMDFNFDSNECRGYYNDQLLGVLETCHTKFPDRFYLAVSASSLSETPHVFETTLFAVKNRV